MEVGHIIEKDGIEYCICDIKKYGNHDYAYAIKEENEKSDFVFFQFEDDENGTMIKLIENEDVIAELIPIFIEEEE